MGWATVVRPSLSVLLILLIHARRTSASRTFSIQWRHMNCSIIEPDYVQQLQCLINSTTGGGIDLQLTYKKPLTQLSIEFVLHLPRPDTTMFKFLRVRVDGCNLFGLQTKNRILKSVVRDVLVNTNFPRKCPMKANYTYYVRNFKLDPNLFPHYTPPMNFTINLNLMMPKSKASPMAAIAIAAGITKGD